MTNEDKTSSFSQVELRNATKFYGDVAAVRDVNLFVKKGEFFSILGSSGGGKTTILRIIAGLTELSCGELRLAGRRVDDIPVYKRNVGIMFQNYALFPHMNIFDNIAFGLRMRRLGRGEIETRVKAALARMRMDGFEERKPSQLSGGQQQRIALARAIVVNPEVVLLDEPLGALDRNLRLDMQAELKQLQRELKITMICVTHDQEEALSLSDRLAVLRHGQIQQIGTPIDIYEHPSNYFVANFIGGTNMIEGKYTAPNGLKLPDGRLLIARKDKMSFTQGCDAVISLRYEALEILRTGRPTPEIPGTILQATIIAIAYGGAESLFHVQTDNGLVLIVAQKGIPNHQMGEIVRVFLPENQSLLLGK